MNSLEDFFIRTVASAEQEKQPTSGVVSSAVASHFPVEKPIGSGILDKLVSATVNEEKPAEKVETEPVEMPAGSEENNVVLEKLTTTKVIPQKEIVSPTTPTDIAEPDEQIREDILDKLRNSKKPAGGDDDA